MTERCEACGSDGVTNSTGRFVSRDWLRANELKTERDELIAALKRIADGPWPDDCEGPEEQCRFDEGVARAALKKVGADGTADKRPNANVTGLAPAQETTK